jgi:hypothetical protein
MTTTTPTPAMPKIRLYLDNGKTNPLVDTSILSQHMRAMFIHWVRAHRHEYDFIDAAENVATGLYTDYLMHGSPDLTIPGTVMPDFGKLGPAPVPSQVQLKKPALRYYDAKGDLELEIDTDPYRQVLIPFMFRWIAANYHQREFIQVVKDVALTVYHDFTIACSMGGLGGCKTREEFLNSPLEL